MAEEYENICPACEKNRKECNENVSIEKGRWVHSKNKKQKESVIIHHKRNM